MWQAGQNPEMQLWICSSGYLVADTAASFPIFRGIDTNRRRCITDRPYIFSYIWNFHILSIFSCIWNFHFLGRRGELRLPNCWMQVAEYIAAPVARERPVADSSSLLDQPPPCPPFTHLSYLAHQGLTSEQEACAVFWLLQKISSSEVNQNDCCECG